MDYNQWPVLLGDLFVRLSRVVTDYFPNIVGATFLLIVGWLLSWLVRAAVKRLIARLNRLIPDRVVGREIRSSGVDQMASDVVGAVVFWAVFLFFLAASMESLGLMSVTSGLGRLAAYLPNILAAALELLAGLVLGNLTRSIVGRTAGSAGFAHADALGRSAKAVILLLSSVIALDQIGVDSTLLILVSSIAIGVVLGGLALGFGLGARTVVSNILASHYARQAYQVGQSLRVGAVQGRLDEIRPTCFVIETAEGSVFVPAKEFTEGPSVRLHEKDVS